MGPKPGSLSGVLLEPSGWAAREQSGAGQGSRWERGRLSDSVPRGEAESSEERQARHLTWSPATRIQHTTQSRRKGQHPRLPRDRGEHLEN